MEFDLGHTVRSKRTLNANLKWNWNTSHRYTPSMVFNLFEARGEWRQYFRTRQRGGAPTTMKEGFIAYFRDNYFTTKRRKPRDYRAYYWGIYANTSSYNIKLTKEGRQGTAYSAGLSVGYTTGLYGYKNHAVDLELGASVGLMYTHYDVYRHDAESDCYPVLTEKCKEGHLVPFPVVSDVRVAFVYRFVSAKDKYKQSVFRRADIRQEKRNKLNEQINKMRQRLDSIQSVYKRRKEPVPDSLLSPTERKEWRKMQEEQQAKEEEAAAMKLRRHLADSLGIQLNDTVKLTKQQEKALRDAEEAHRDALKKQAKAAKEGKADKEEPGDEVNADGKKAKKEKDGKEKAEKLKKEKKEKKSMKEKKEPEAEAPASETVPAEAADEEGKEGQP